MANVTILGSGGFGWRWQRFEMDIRSQSGPNFSRSWMPFAEMENIRKNYRVFPFRKPSD